MSYRQNMIDHAAASYPNESCGLLVRTADGLAYLSAQNLAPEPTETAIIDPEAWIEADRLGDVVGIVHSHPDGPFVLSGADRLAQQQSGLPWYLVVGEQVREFPPVPPLLGRRFEHGQTDCYTLFRDAYALAGHALPDFERDPDWWEQGKNLYLENLPEHGFFQVAEPQPGDVLLIQLASNTPNHTAIYLGDSKLLHHCPDRLSGRDLFGGYWQKHLHSIWRYKQWQSSDFTGIFNDLVAGSNSV
ncbi:C40 family peptidase [Photobacterium sp. 1_MG-2023]|uniref:C40 family peptidase n=1 Tax=Photobacterium sp. 1_MG-2023 TaxID=3062646 RepID=UPI0026E1253B|nr:C40 family peptidase [Photobacterium sp. 1_MG-2023]MDO6707916.1 C40 family peptidase [Photobacterium sp. 1_MG-2023]